MFCRNCAQPITGADAVCPRCGQPTGAAAFGQPQPFGAPPGQPPAAFGSPYGSPYRQNGAPVPGVMPKQRIAYILLGLFIGTLGVHNFYAGYNGKAIAQLLITLLVGWWLILPLIGVWIWNLVEICTVDHDANGYPMT
jgi:TM2 domain-containing membrane protein YozV